MTDSLRLNKVCVHLSNKPIVHDFSIRLETGEIGCLLGPSGCGKTTMLRTIAGFEQPHSGEIHLHEALVSSPTQSLAIEQRGVGMVFQDYALFPHLSVRKNIAFGLNSKLKTADTSTIEQRVNELAVLLEISELQGAYPHRLSGGQQQRVAIARALAPRPQILLLDEPFASMDVELREHLARDIRKVLKQEGITALLVSHNQLEAFAMADKIGVMNNGHLLQWDNAFNLYHKPVSSYVAGFIGEGTLIPGSVIDTTTIDTELGAISDSTAHGVDGNQQVSVLIRPDDVIHNDDSPYQLTIADKAFRGAEFLYTLSLPSGDKILSLAPSHHDHDIGEKLGIELNIDHLVAFPQ